MRVRHTSQPQRSERERIAAHLHDNAAQSLSIIGLKMDQVAATLGPALPAEASQQLETVKEISRQLMAQVRAAFGELRQPPSQSDDLLTALAGCIESFSQAVHVPVEFAIAGPCMLTSDAQAQALLIVREALNNVARHAHATSVQVKLLGDKKTVRIVVEDNGVGFDLRAAGADQRHLGTLLMHERAQRSGGALLINSHPGRGTEVTLTYPAAPPA